MENHASVTGWQKLLFSYKCFSSSAAVAIATLKIYGSKFSGYLNLICSFSLCYQNFSKANCFCVYRKLITWSPHAKGLSFQVPLFCILLTIVRRFSWKIMRFLIQKPNFVRIFTFPGWWFPDIVPSLIFQCQRVSSEWNFQVVTSNMIPIVYPHIDSYTALFLLVYRGTWLT